MNRYKIYGEIHKKAKKLLRRNLNDFQYRLIDVNEKHFALNNQLIVDKVDCDKTINNISAKKQIYKKDVYPIENYVLKGTFLKYEDSFGKKISQPTACFGVSEEESCEKWNSFIDNSIIPTGYKNAGLHYSGYILEYDNWCLPSWIWTNAALVRMYCYTGQIEKAIQIANMLVSMQHESGGWIVRNDYDQNGPIPILAPNDSAYIANNCCLNCYIKTNNQIYLNSAIKCADWIINNARSDGMVYVGYNCRDLQWQKTHNIVDVGFTAGLFANLYIITNNERYKSFLSRFTEKYIQLFYNPKKQGFSTSLDSNEKQIGGLFGRGQAWALEGLIPAFKVMQDKRIEKIINNTVNNLIKKQDRTGAWAYNLSQPLMGLDCKATSAIALSLLNWSTEERIISSAKKALKWCLDHTSNSGKTKGGIFSYTIEGAIVHHMYTSVAFVYACAYAIELKKKLELESET